MGRDSKIALRYRATALAANTVYVPNLGTGEQLVFKTARFPKPRFKWAKDSAIMLNGRAVQHQYHKRKIFDVTISSDEIGTTTLDLLESFMGAAYKYVAYSYIDAETGQLAWTPYYEVFTDEETLPISFIEDLEYLPEVSLPMYAAEAE